MKQKKYIYTSILVLIFIALSLFLVGRGHMIDIFYLLILAVLGILGYKFYHKTTRVKDVPIDVPRLSREKESHYIKEGMTQDEIIFFRQTMAETKKQIEQLSHNMESVAKLKAINLRYDTLKASKGLFKELVRDPKKLHLADHFLYHHLPNIVELTNKYIEINNHDIKTKNTYTVLNDSAVAIEEASILISQDYVNFVSDDIDDIEVEISIAKQNVNRDKRYTDDDDLFEEDF